MAPRPRPEVNWTRPVARITSVKGRVADTLQKGRALVLRLLAELPSSRLTSLSIY